MFILDSLLVGGIRFVLEKVVAAAEAEMQDDAALREQLLEAQMRLELGEISDGGVRRDRTRHPRAHPRDQGRRSTGALTMSPQPTRSPASTSKPTDEDHDADSSAFQFFFGGKGGVGKTTCAAGLRRGAARSGRACWSCRPIPRTRWATRWTPALVAPDDVSADSASPRRRACTPSSSTPRAPSRDGCATIAARSATSRPRHLARPGGRRRAAAAADAGHRRADRPARDRSARQRLQPLRPASSSTPRRPATRCGSSLLRQRSAPSLRVLDALQADHRVIRERFARVSRPDRPIDSSLSWKITHGSPQICFAISSACVVHWVTVPEALAIEETIDAERALRASGISVSELVLNRITPPGPPCPLCDRRRRSESRRSCSGP